MSGAEETAKQAFLFRLGIQLELSIKRKCRVLGRTLHKMRKVLLIWQASELPKGSRFVLRLRLDQVHMTLDCRSRSLGLRKVHFRFGTGSRRPLTKHDTVPGPGAYSDRSEPAGPQISIKGKYNDFRPSEIPGPGAYNSDQSIARQAANSPHYSFTRDKKGLKIAGSDAPGPANYAQTGSPFTTQGSKFGTDSKSPRVNNENPGPGAYDPKRPASAGGVVIASRHPTKPPDAVPGPSAYSPQLASPKTPQYSIGSAPREGRSQSGIPGPGHYDDRSLSAGIKNRSAAYKIGTEHRGHGFVGGKPPGEGTGPMYHWELPPNPPIWGFGTQDKGWKTNSVAPGPGQYDIPTTIAVVPPYTKPV